MDKSTWPATQAQLAEIRKLGGTATEGLTFQGATTLHGRLAALEKKDRKEKAWPEEIERLRGQGLSVGRRVRIHGRQEHVVLEIDPAKGIRLQGARGGWRSPLNRIEVLSEE